MPVWELKERIDSEELEGWKAWFQADKPGGPRTPQDEMTDLMMARLLTWHVNSNRDGWPVEIREMMIYQPPPQDVSAKIERAKALFRLRASQIREQRKRLSNGR